VVLLAGGAFAVAAPTAGAVGVSDEATLRSQFADPSVSSITIDADITLSDCGSGALTRSSSTSIAVSAGAGNTITQTCSADVFDLTGLNSFTGNGLTLNAPQNRDGVESVGDVTFTNGTINVVGDGNAISGDNVTVSHSALHGIGAGDGISSSSATLTSSVIDGVTEGDGISTGDATVTDSSIISTNDDGCDGISSGSAIVTRSTIVGCTDGISTGDATLTNSTVTGATSDGISAGHVTLVFSDVVGNRENISTDTLESTGSVVAGATNGANCSSSTTSHGFNFDDDGSCGFDQPTDQSDAGDPGLGALADNGGPTQTFLPQAGSPLLDKVPAASCTVDTDQRGVSRPQGSGCDIGAVEVVPDTTTTSSTTTTTTTTVPTPPPAAKPVVVQPNFAG
jgi:hypothetical protein